MKTITSNLRRFVFLRCWSLTHLMCMFMTRTGLHALQHVLLPPA